MKIKSHDPAGSARIAYALNRPLGIQPVEIHRASLPLSVTAKLVRAYKVAESTKHNKHLTFSKRLPRHIKRGLNRFRKSVRVKSGDRLVIEGREAIEVISVEPAKS